ncbi:DnaJ-domain-containing protein [Artomyces pyxidatus]|uniref:DnaJ-domain-containing protein n=1 Tax=Artomyces pyxidatus TaxID=48021 RepID=A0ACB8TG18_9AGAM|nr:DnaJ-domain-containing protein [Artomyces pyxidatus]
MLRYVVSSASDYFYLPIDDDEPSTTVPPHAKHISWDYDQGLPDTTGDRAPNAGPGGSSQRRSRRAQAIADILAQTDLYNILGVSRSDKLDTMDLRRAYLSRSKACHPDKFPDNPEATYAFQKVSVAYNVLSNPASRRLYDSHPGAQDFTTTSVRAEETLRSVVIGVFNDFLDGDLEMVRTLLRGINDLNPSLRVSDEGINSILLTLQSLRERILTCRALTHTLLSTLSHLLDTHASLAKLSYFSLRPRARLSIRLARITLALPLALDREMALQRRARARSRRRREHAVDMDVVDDNRDIEIDERKPERTLFPRRILVLIESLIVGLEKMEGVLT